MHPAYSVLFLTTLIGAGQGLLIALVTGQWYFVIGAEGATVRESGLFYGIGSLIALLLLALGLFASFFHLARPMRGWRAAHRWRTSWLSREVLLLPATMGLTFLYGVLHALNFNPALYTFGNMKTLDLTMATGFLAGAAAGMLFICTGMIYACVRFIREWASWWTVINFTLMGLASGFTLAAAYSGLFGSPLTAVFAGLALLLTVLALIGKGVAVWRNRLLPRFKLKSAIGVHHDQIRQITQGFLGSSFNTTEFRAPGGKDLPDTLTWAYLAIGFAVPAGLLVVGWVAGQPLLYVLAVLAQYAGLLTERWVFFASGQHVQNLYYQAKA
jgi:DMSO reductase anchor subunit